MPTTRRQQYFAACRDPQVWRRTLLLGLPVGFLQAALNQGDHWLQHRVDGVVILKTILCPFLSCAIALVSALATHRTKELDPTSS
jgi:hypothetical protein